MGTRSISKSLVFRFYTNSDDLVMLEDVLKKEGVIKPKVAICGDTVTVILEDRKTQEYVGFYTFGKVDNSIHLRHFYVFPKHRNTYVARLLIRDFLARTGLTKFIATIIKGNKVLLRLLKYKFKTVTWFKEHNNNDYYLVEV